MNRRSFLKAASGLLVPATLGVEPVEVVRRFWALDRTMAGHQYVEFCRYPFRADIGPWLPTAEEWDRDITKFLESIPA